MAFAVNHAVNEVQSINRQACAATSETSSVPQHPQKAEALPVTIRRGSGTVGHHRTQAILTTIRSLWRRTRQPVMQPKCARTALVQASLCPPAFRGQALRARVKRLNPPGTTKAWGLLALICWLAPCPDGWAVPPPNDLCSGALVVPTAGPFPYLTPPVDILDATVTNDPPAASCQPFVGRSVWFVFTPSVTTNYTISSRRSPRWPRCRWP